MTKKAPGPSDHHLPSGPLVHVPMLPFRCISFWSIFQAFTHIPSKPQKKYSIGVQTLAQPFLEKNLPLSILSHKCVCVCVFILMIHSSCPWTYSPVAPPTGPQGMDKDVQCSPMHAAGGKDKKIRDGNQCQINIGLNLKNKKQ